MKVFDAIVDWGLAILRELAVSGFWVVIVASALFAIMLGIGHYADRQTKAQKVTRLVMLERANP